MSKKAKEVTPVAAQPVQAARPTVKSQRRPVALPESCPYAFKENESVMCEMSRGKWEPVTYVRTVGKFHYAIQRRPDGYNGGKEFRIWLNKLMPVGVYNQTVAKKTA